MLTKFKDYLRQNDSALSEFLFSRYYEKREKHNATLCGVSMKKEKGECDYINKWSKILRYPTPYAYRFYSKYTGITPNIVSQTAANKINEILNPSRYIGYLQDKNCFDKILPTAPFPKTILRKIQGQLYNNLYEPIYGEYISDQGLYDMLVPYQKFVVKETIDSDSGRGIYVFELKEGKFINVKDGERFSKDWLKKCNDCIVQEALTQAPFMSQFNPSSVNTIRVAVYRSVIDNKPHVLSTVIRMGMKDSVIDNLHGGGRMVRVWENGELAHYCIDQFGRKYDSHNAINFKTETLILPYYNEIKELVKDLSCHLTNARLIQWDIAIDENNVPRVLEFNITGFSMWIAQMTGTPAYGKYTDEIIDYVSSHINENAKSKSVSHKSK